MFFVLTFILVSFLIFFLIRQYEIQRKIIGINVMGGLGNVLFQFAFIYSLSRKYNCKFTMIGIHNYQNPHSTTDYNYIKQCITNLPNFASTFTQIPIQIKEFNEFNYDEYNHKFNYNIQFIGYYQSEEYFKKYRNEILEILKEPCIVTTVLNSSDIDFEHGFFLHIRLTDYANFGFNLPIEYYTKCIQILPNYISTIYVFSDDTYKAKDILQSFDKQFIFITDLNEIETLYCMARMKYGGICANSTFSWWGSWLNTSPHKLIYMPKPWLTNHDCRDIYPDGTNVIQY